MGDYEKGEVKRIASWRAKKIHKDFLELIGKRPEMPLYGLGCLGHWGG